MPSSKLLHFFLIIIIVTVCGGCGSGGGSSSSSGGGIPAPPVVSGNNVMAITVNGSLCSNSSYTNKPCVSVTICTPGTSNCQTIDDILLDTGDSGLRIFTQVIGVSLRQLMSGSNAIAECIQYADGSSVWGSVKMAGVVLGNETAVQVPIQVIDSTVAGAPASCSGAFQTPAEAGYNGSLGLSFFAQDCGPACASSTGNGIYYACSTTTCAGAAVPVSSQVMNPVVQLPVDNNGVIIQLPGIPAGGATSASGSLVLGIGTQTNNMPSTVTAYSPDSSGNIITNFDGRNFSAFLDTGSNGLFFPSPSNSTLPNCAAPDSEWYCPATTMNLTATNKGGTGVPSGVVSFSIGNFDTLFASPNNVFPDIGGNNIGAFDWGIPFFFGRNVYIGMEGKGSSLGSGPYWAY